jgi:hypothetical protein
MVDSDLDDVVWVVSKLPQEREVQAKLRGVLLLMICYGMFELVADRGWKRRSLLRRFGRNNKI